jgi:hypothetical protein
MFAQVIHARLRPGSSDRLHDFVAKWGAKHGKSLLGCTEIIVNEEIGGKGRCAIVVLFDSKHSLDDFSAKTETKQFFDDAKVLVGGNLEHYDAVARQTSLL